MGVNPVNPVNRALCGLYGLSLPEGVAQSGSIIG